MVSAYNRDTSHLRGFRSTGKQAAQNYESGNHSDRLKDSQSEARSEASVLLGEKEDVNDDDDDDM